MLESLLYMILRGIVIGVVVSAPMGPVGIFCIQRTLDKGRLSGFYTGVGAAISDLIYCLLTGFGLSFIEEFIDRHRDPIQMLGSVVLIFFGIWLIRKKPDGDTVAADPDHDSPSREGDILKGFALTFSNPLILFLIIGLFAQFNFVIEGIKFYHYVLGFIGIIAGALGWWWVVTYFVDKLRGHFNQRTMKLINTIVGIIILIFAAVGIVSSASSLLMAQSVPLRVSPSSSMSASFRVADPSMRGWQIGIPCEDGRELKIDVSPVSAADPFGDSSIDALQVKAMEYPEGRELDAVLVSQGVDTYRGKNAWRVVRSGNNWNIFAGNRDYNHILGFESQCIPSGPPEIASASSVDVSVTDFLLDHSSFCLSGSSEADVFLALQQSSGKRTDLQGIYSLLDYEFDDTFARSGGSYRLAVVPDGDSGNFDIFYLAGATVNPTLWAPGMRKGRLLPTPFANIFNVEWCDSEGALMLHDLQAEFDPLALSLSIKFPYQNSTLRFRKE